jgi:hypothetical protein
VNKPDLPDSLSEFGHQLEDAVRRRQRRFARPPRLPRRSRRLTAGLGVATVAGVAAVIAVVLGSSATSAAYAVTQNGNGTVTVRWLRVAQIDRSNLGRLTQRLHALGIKANVVAASGVAIHTLGPGACPKLGPITLQPADMKHGLTVTVDRAGRLGIAHAQVEQVIVGQTALAAPNGLPPSTPPAGVAPAFRKATPSDRARFEQHFQREIRLPHGVIVARCGPPHVVLPPGAGTSTTTTGTGATTTGTTTSDTATTPTTTAPWTETVTTPTTTSPSDTSTTPTHRHHRNRGGGGGSGT